MVEATVDEVTGKKTIEVNIGGSLYKLAAPDMATTGGITDWLKNQKRKEILVNAELAGIGGLDLYELLDKHTQHIQWEDALATLEGNITVISAMLKKHHPDMTRDKLAGIINMTNIFELAANVREVSTPKNSEGQKQQKKKKAKKKKSR